MMRYTKVIFLSLLVICALAQRISSQPPARGKRIVIAVSAALDGKGRVLRNTRIVIEGAKIIAIDPKAGPVDYDLRGLTVAPGWIDAHVHITSSFGSDGKFGGEVTAEESNYQTASNAWATLLGGFTTVQTMSHAVALRDAIAKGLLPGPRILTIVQDLPGRGEQSGTPDEIRAYVRKQKEAGADLIKIYASGGMLSGAKTLSQEQLSAACDEAKKQGLRTRVHAFRDAVPAATLAGCTQIEHGLGATDDDLKLMAEKGTYLDPQGGALLENYLLNKAMYVGRPYFPKTEAEMVAAMFTSMPRAARPLNHCDADGRFNSNNALSLLALADTRHWRDRRRAACALTGGGSGKPSYVIAKQYWLSGIGSTESPSSTCHRYMTSMVIEVKRLSL